MSVLLRQRSILILLGLALAIAFGLASAAPPAAKAPPPPAKPTTQDCMGCHDGTIEKSSADDRKGMVEPVAADWKPTGPRSDFKRAGVGLTVDPKKLEKSVHGADCANCHADIASLPHRAKLQPANCAGCHGDVDYRKSAHFAAAMKGEKWAPACGDCHGAHDILGSTDPAARTNRENVAKMCGQCHTAGRIGARTGGAPYDEWAVGVHGRKKDGTRTNATCNDCHLSHDTHYAGPTSKINIAATCGKCHKKEREQYELGVHGVALARGDLSSPTCNDCHGTHNIRATHDPMSQVYGFRSVSNVCGECHQAERVNARYGIPMTAESYLDSFHGLAMKKGDLRVAGCASCHGAHAILLSSDPRSSVHPDNLVQTCGACHPGIGSGAVQGKVHPSLSKDAGTLGEKIQFWVRWIYLGLIPAVLGFMFFHNLIDWIKKVRAHLRRMKAMGVYERLTFVERAQHIVLMISFTLLVISGFALVFGWKIPGLSGELNEEIRADVHRIAALMMIGWAVYHAYWAALTKRGRGYIRDMLPNLKDAYDMVYMMAYNLGLWPSKPEFERFTYVEKMEYLAMVWGTAVMVATGLILWFEEPFLRILPLWAVDVANIIHYMEAILATLAIIIWHFYSVLFNPDVAPMATHWLTGKLTAEEMEHEHGLEWERVQAERRRAEMAAAAAGEQGAGEPEKNV